MRLCLNIKIWFLWDCVTRTLSCFCYLSDDYDGIMNSSFCPWCLRLHVIFCHQWLSLVTCFCLMVVNHSSSLCDSFIRLLSLFFLWLCYYGLCLIVKHSYFFSLVAFLYHFVILLHWLCQDGSLLILSHLWLKSRYHTDKMLLVMNEFN
jgi:hypothetical protein